jgi:hypothetical protein
MTQSSTAAMPTAQSAAAAWDAGHRYALSKQGISAAVQSGLPEIQECYEQWRRFQPSLAGRLTVHISIETEDGTEGHVAHVSTGDAGLGNIAFEGCVLSIISGLRFDPPLDGGFDTTFPLSFVQPPPVSSALQPALENLCSSIRAEASKAEFANVNADELLTVVWA